MHSILLEDKLCDGLSNQMILNGIIHAQKDLHRFQQMVERL